MKDRQSFAMLESVDVWCRCGKLYSVVDRSDDETGKWQEQCPNCGERVELTFIFHVVAEVSA